MSSLTHYFYAGFAGRSVGMQTNNHIKGKSDASPPSDQPVFDHAYYATTPPSSSPDGEGKRSKCQTSSFLLCSVDQVRKSLFSRLPFGLSYNNEQIFSPFGKSFLNFMTTSAVGCLGRRKKT